MKRNNLSWMLASILFLCGPAVALTSCNDKDDDDIEVPNKQEEEKTDIATKANVLYYVDLGANTLELADVEVTYIDENGTEQKFKMTEKQWVLERTVLANQMPAHFSLKVTFEEKDDVTPEADKEYEFGCVARIPFTVYNSNGVKICDHPGTVVVTDGTHPKIKGSQMKGWWLTYSLGINPDKLLNFDKKTLTVKPNAAVFNKLNYKYPYFN